MCFNTSVDLPGGSGFQFNNSKNKSLFLNNKPCIVYSCKNFQIN